MTLTTTKSQKVEVSLLAILDNPNAKKQRIFDEVGMIELITRLL